MALTSYRADIDGLRAVAVLAVVLNHLSSALMPGGFVGVDVFFVISGYLITRIIAQEIGEGRFTFARFYERRARRIFPALFAVLAATLAAGYALLLPSDYLVALRAALATLLFGSNLLLWRQQSGYFEATESKLDPLLHTWSLAVEEQFYLLFPVFLLVCHRYWKKRILWILLAGTAVSLVGAVILAKGNRTAAFFLSPFRAWELLAGSLLAYGALPAIGSRLAREALAAGGLAAIVLACVLYDDGTVFPGLAALAPVLGAAALIHAGSSGPTLAGRLLQWRPVVYVGLISYSLYLWHWPIIVLAQYANGMASLSRYWPLLLLACLLVASASYHFIEQPFRRSAGAPSRLALPSWAALAAGLGLFCTVGALAGGFPGRFSPTVLSLDKARTPLVPHDHCSNRAPEAACLLGAGEDEPQMLLWGDSHLVSLAPVLHDVLGERGARAVFLPYLACAPAFEVGNAVRPTCPDVQARVKDYLLANPQIKTVVMVGYWRNYFREGSPVRMMSAGGEAVAGPAAAHAGLRTTLQWLAQNGRSVMLIGQMPAYDRSVPAALALEAATGRKLARSSASQERLANAPFLALVDEFEPDVRFQYVDPVPWLCAQECRVIEESVSLYRDAHHLSVAGAMSIKAELSQAFARGGEPPRAVRVASP